MELIVNENEELKKSYPLFDFIFDRIFFDSVIQYGIIKGNNKILFIKPGQDGSLVGYNDKYYNLAEYINKKYGYTVICSNNPYVKSYNPLDDAVEVIEAYVKKMNYDNFEVYYLGNSCGGMLGARYAHLYPVIKKALLVNTPLFVSFHKINEGLLKFKGNKMVFVYGSLDPSCKFIGLLDLIENDRVSYIVLEGEDHNLSSNIFSLEYLLDNYLLND